MRSCLCGRLTPGYLLERLGCITHTTATLHPPGRAAHSRDKVAGAPGAPPTGAPPTGAPPRVQPGRRGAAVGRALARDGDRRGRRGAALRAARGLPARGRAARGRAPRGGRGLPEADVLGLPRAPCGGEPPRCSSSGPCAALEACVLRRLRASLQAPQPAQGVQHVRLPRAPATCIHVLPGQTVTSRIASHACGTESAYHEGQSGWYCTRATELAYQAQRALGAQEAAAVAGALRQVQVRPGAALDLSPGGPLYIVARGRVRLTAAAPAAPRPAAPAPDPWGRASVARACAADATSGDGKALRRAALAGAALREARPQVAPCAAAW